MSLDNTTTDQATNRSRDDEAAFSYPDPWCNEGPGQFPAPGETYETWQIPWADSFEDAGILAEERCPPKGQSLVWSFQWMHPWDVARYIGMQGLLDRLDWVRELAYESWGLVESVERYGVTEPILLHDDLIEGSHRLWAALAIGLKRIPVLQGKIVHGAGSSLQVAAV